MVVDAATGRVFVADTGNNRVLRFASAAALTNGADAELVIGQPDFTSNGSASPPTAASLDSPTGLALDSSGRLWVADTDNNRVLMFPGATTSTTNGGNATIVFGQSGFGNESLSPAGNATLNAPQGLYLDANGLLWVADTGNNRVLRFGSATPSVPAAFLTANNGVAAGGKLGQESYTDSSASSLNTRLSAPSGLAMDASGTLWIADTGNHRVVGFPNAAVISSNLNASNASRILGQPDFNTGSNTPGVSSSRVNTPTGVFADGSNNLWVVDQGNHRILRFSALSSIQNGSGATRVIGQSNFTNNGPGLSARQLNTPGLGIAVPADGSLWIADSGNHRVLRYVRTDDTNPTVTVRGRRTLTTSQASILLRGAATDDVGVTSVKVGRKLASGTTRWKCRVTLKPGRNVLKAQAFDASGRRSAPVLVVVTRS